MSRAAVVLAALLWDGRGVRAAVVGARSGQARADRDLSESLANQLLSLSVSVRRNDLAEVRTHFPAEGTLEATPFPTLAGETMTVEKWIAPHAWELREASRSLRREELLESLREFLGHFSSIEDARFKVKGAEFDLDEPVRSLKIDNRRGVEPDVAGARPGGLSGAGCLTSGVGRGRDSQP